MIRINYLLNLKGQLPDHRVLLPASPQLPGEFPAALATQQVGPLG